MHRLMIDSSMAGISEHTHHAPGKQLPKEVPGPSEGQSVLLQELTCMEHLLYASWVLNLTILIMARAALSSYHRWGNRL